MLSPNGVRAILFDLDGTLRYNCPSSVQTFLDYAAQLGAPDTTEAHLKAHRWTHSYWAQSPELMADLRRFGADETGFWTHHAEIQLIAMGCSPEQAAAIGPELHRRMAENYRPQDWVPPDVPATLALLQQAGFILGVVSNRTKPYLDQLEALGLKDFFQFALAGGEVNAYKPDPELFQAALQRLGMQPDETVYVGDNYYADVLGSQRAGLRPVLVDPEGIFPEARCPVIRTIGELPAVLEN